MSQGGGQADPTGAGHWLARQLGRLILRPGTTPDVTGERHASWLELFFDLVFVLTLGAIVDRLGHDPTPQPLEIAAVAGLFLVTQWAWAGILFYDTRYDPDDVPHRLMVLVAMAGAGTIGLGVADAPETILLPIGYLIVRGVLLLLYLRVRPVGGLAREVTTVYLIGFGTGWLIWLGSVFAPASVRPALWIIAMAIELATPWLGMRWLAHAPVDTSHLPERIGQFTIIVLGSTLIDLLDAAPDRPGPRLLVALALAFVAPAAIWWVYATFVTTGLALPRLRAGQSYTYVHVPLAGALLLLGWALGQIIRQLAEGETTLPAELRVVFAGSIITWMNCGLVLHWLSIRTISGQRAAIAGFGIVAVTLTAALATEPVTLLLLNAITLVGYSVLTSRRLTMLRRTLDLP